jgi:hypothetical protein
MGSSSKKRQTFAKMTRERMVKERRALKQQKKDAKKMAAAMESSPEAGDGMFSAPEVEDETRTDVDTQPVGPSEDRSPLAPYRVERGS